MDEKKRKALVAKLAKGLTTEADLNHFSRILAKLTVETALNAELTDYCWHEKNAPETGSNNRNGYSSKHRAALNHLPVLPSYLWLPEAF